MQSLSKFNNIFHRNLQNNLKIHTELERPNSQSNQKKNKTSFILPGFEI